MDSTIKKFHSFLLAEGIPDFVTNLLELYGMTCVDDIAMLNREELEEVMTDIESRVQNGNFLIDLEVSTKQGRIRYLGYDTTNIAAWTLRPFTKKKILDLIPAAMKVTTATAEAATEQRRIEEMRRRKWLVQK